MQAYLIRYVGVLAPLSGPHRMLAVLFCALAMIAWAPNTYAHAALVSSTPTTGAVMPHAPTRVQLIFNEPISPLALKVVQPDGTEKNITKTQVLPAGLQLSLPTLTQQGTHALSWRVVSSDGHPIGGTLTFSVGAPAKAPTLNAEADPGRYFLIWLMRLCGYAGLFFGIGLAVYHTCPTSRLDTRRLAYWTLSLGALATLLSVGLLGVDALDIPLSGLFSSAPWRLASSTTFGLSAALTAVAFACAAMVWRATSCFTQKLMAAVALILLGVALAASGHASGAPPTWLARPAVWLHAIAVTLWIGALLPLAYALGNSTDLRLLRHFSTLIPIVLLLLFASGGVLIYLQIDTLAALWTTNYGRVLILKMGLLTILLGLGAYNRFYLTSAVLRSDLAPRRAMQRIVFLECIVAVAILAVVALWRFTPPPRSVTHTVTNTPVSTATIFAHVQSEAARAEISITPAASGLSAALALYVSNPDFSPLQAQEIDIAFSNTQAGIEPIVFSAIQTGDGFWRVHALELPHQDNWQVRIDVLVSDFKRISLRTTLALSK